MIQGQTLDALAHAATFFDKRLGDTKREWPLLRKAGFEPTEENKRIILDLVHTDVSHSCEIALEFGGLIFRELRIAKSGGRHQGHRHMYDHVTLLVKGRCFAKSSANPIWSMKRPPRSRFAPPFGIALPR